MQTQQHLQLYFSLTMYAVHHTHACRSANKLQCIGYATRNVVPRVVGNRGNDARQCVVVCGTDPCSAVDGTPGFLALGAVGGALPGTGDSQAGD